MVTPQRLLLATVRIVVSKPEH